MKYLAEILGQYHMSVAVLSVNTPTNKHPNVRLLHKWHIKCLAGRQ